MDEDRFWNKHGKEGVNDRDMCANQRAEEGHSAFYLFIYLFLLRGWKDAELIQGCSRTGAKLLMKTASCHQRRTTMWDRPGNDSPNGQQDRPL
jgi:hypothetical protein